MSKRNTSKKANKTINQEILGLMFIALGLILIVSLTGQSPGKVTSVVKNILTGLMGVGAYIIPCLLLVLGVTATFTKLKVISTVKMIAMGIFITMLLVLLHINSSSFNAIKDFKLAWEFGIERFGFNKAGGLIGYILTATLIGLLGKVATYIITITSILVACIVLTNISVKKILIGIQHYIMDIFNRTIKVIKDFLWTSDEGKEDKEYKPLNKDTVKSEPKIEEINSNGKLNIIDYSKDTEDEEREIEKIKVSNSVQPPHNGIKEATSISNSGQQPKLEIEDIEQSKIISPYTFPNSVLLDEQVNKKTSGDRKSIMNNVKILEDTLANFGIGAKVIQVSKGPAITRYELQPNPGIKVSKIVNLSDDLALSLAAPSVRIEAPIPGKSAIGIEIPNKEVTMVSFREVIESDGFMNNSSKLSIALGKDIAGDTVVVDLAKMPHMLIAGATGSGKSVCINTIISSILFKAAPHEVKMILIDPKMVELSNYNGIPHLLVPVVTDPKKASSALGWAVQEMTNRYKLFSKEGVKDIYRYNQVMKESYSSEFMPQIVIIIDELADLMMVSASEVEDLICRLAQMARAAGIHLIVATQRPSVDVITGVIKANIPSRISFAVSSQIDSRTILDCSGAEKLLGRGDMLLHPVGDSKMTRVQCAYISEKEVDRIVEFIKNQTDPQYSTQILEEIVKPQVDSNLPAEDDLYQEALRIVVESEQASISMLQRRLKVGYARAARLIDELESKGIIGGYEGSKPRQVLVKREKISN